MVSLRYSGTGNYGQIGNYTFERNTLQDLPWKICGKSFDQPVFVKDALKACGAKYGVAKGKLLAMTPELEDKILNGRITKEELQKYTFLNRCTTYRTDNKAPLGIVSPSYGIVQNEFAFNFIDKLCTGDMADRDNTPVITNAGVLGYGERVFITAKFPQSVILDNKGDDRVDMYIVFTNSHDGQGSVTGLITPIRVWCNNTLALAFHNNSGKVTYRHTAHVMKRLDLMDKENREFAYKSLNVFDVYAKSLKDNFEHLRNIKIAEKELDGILAEMYLSADELKAYQSSNDLESRDISNDSKSVIFKIKDSIESGVGQNDKYNGTALGFINGITTYYQNSRSYRSAESKFRCLLDGEAKAKVQKAFQLVDEIK